MINDKEISNRLKTSSKFFKTLLLMFILIPFLFIHWQQFRPYVSFSPLKGYFIAKQYSPISHYTWLNGTYQTTTEDYVKEEFGFRNFLVRLHNQLDYWLFKKANAEKVIIGKENYLYETGYIDALNGVFFMGHSALNDTVEKIKLLNSKLEALGKKMLIVLAPSKARVYPEFIPDSYLISGVQNTNYDFYKEALRAAGINHIDFNSIFLNKKKTSKYLLFPQLGVHWSRMEAIHAADTIFKHLSYIGKCNLPTIDILNIEEKDSLESPDDDMILSLNLLKWPDYKKMAYPTIAVNQTQKDKKSCMVISDSFWWDIYSRGLPNQVFENNEFWYYLTEIRSTSFLNKKLIDDIDVKRHLLQNDFILVICTESNLSRLGFGFFHTALDALSKSIEPTTKELNEIISVITKSDSWMKDIQRKSKENKISVDSMLVLDAHWYFQNRGPINNGITIEEVIQSAYDNPNWLNSIKEKAEKNRISVDSMVKLDAAWFMIHELNAPEKAKKYLTLNAVKEIIRKNKTWYMEVENKSKNQKISVDSMLTLDALWYLSKQ